jgi:RPA family protein
MAGYTREVARRVFAAELRASNLSFREGDEQQQYAPQFILTPTGARCNRVFFVGTLTERDDIGGDAEYWRGRVSDPTGSVFVYAGQYQPEAARTLSSITPPAFVAVVGKPSLYEPEDGRKLISVRAEAIQKVDEPVAIRWVLDTAARTIDRLSRMKAASESADGSVPTAFTKGDAYRVEISSDDISRARLHYGTEIGIYRDMVLKALLSLMRSKPLGEADMPVVRVEPTIPSAQPSSKRSEAGAPIESAARKHAVEERQKDIVKGKELSRSATRRTSDLSYLGDEPAIDSEDMEDLERQWKSDFEGAELVEEIDIFSKKTPEPRGRRTKQP